MSDLIDDPEPGQNAPEFSVSEVSGAVKRMIEGEFGHVRIRGEVGRVSRPASGHMYLDLKDDRAVLASVIWKGVAGRLRTQPEEGMEVVATGKLTTFAGQSRYQMVIEDIAPAGVGALMAMLEKRKKALAAEGLFDADRKQPIPYLPEVIGVITSPSGAVIRDILHRLRDRFPRKVLIWPVAVQGEKCAPEVTAAIQGFNTMSKGGSLPRPDLLIVARGGGSIEDLWGFNEEAVVRAARASDIPLISAVGHETDTTLIDFASDMRAPTPTAAAEAAVPVRADLMASLAALEERRLRSLAKGIDTRRQRLADLSRGLPNPVDQVALQGQRLDMVATRLPLALNGLVAQKLAVLSDVSAGLSKQTLRQMIVAKQQSLENSAGRLPRALKILIDQKTAALATADAGLRPQTLHQNVVRRRADLDVLASRFAQAANGQIERSRLKLDALDRLRISLGYTATLERGYAVVRNDAGELVTTVSEAEQSNGLDVQFKDGHFSTGSGGLAVKPVPKKQAAKKPKKEAGQGSLFD